MMKVAILVFVLVAAYISYEALHLWYYYRESRMLVAVAVRFERVEGIKRMLVLGDSIAVGVGADTPNHSVVGRLASEKLDHSVENHSVVGARISDLFTQLGHALFEHYDLAFITIGANDIIRFKSAAKAEQELEQFLSKLRGRVDRVVFLTAGNVGAAPIVPLVLRSLYHRRTLEYHEVFQGVAERTNSTFVNLYEKPESDQFLREPDRFLAADRLHPSSEGYRLYFERTLTRL
jgi:lysophospholipase L1-like esterase